MDVHCTTCGELWDTHHLMHDAIHETRLPSKDILAWRRLPSGERLQGRFRDEFLEAGWHFGRSMLNVIRCPACPAGACPEPDTLHLKAELEEILTGDEDGLIAEYIELNL